MTLVMARKRKGSKPPEAEMTPEAARTPKRKRLTIDATDEILKAVDKRRFKESSDKAREVTRRELVSKIIRDALKEEIEQVRIQPRED